MIDWMSVFNGLSLLGLGCVIMIADSKRPTEEMLEKGFNANDAGAGLAWREDGLVKWKKGIMEVEEVQEMVKSLPLPFIVHFRIPTEGGRRIQLCHPFPIEPKVNLSLEGKTKGYVLFHNGHWNDWRKWSLETAIGSKIPLPPGKWSDTRGMAFVASIYGLGVLEMINEKAVAFGPSDIEVVPGGGFTFEDGVWFSNMYWKNRTSYHGPNYNITDHRSDHRRMCRQSTCTNTLIDDTGYCKEHTQKKVTPSEEGTEKDGNTTVDDAAREAALGVAASDIPFDLAVELYAEKKITKKQFKKARRAYEQLLREGKIQPYHRNLQLVRTSETKH